MANSYFSNPINLDTFSGKIDIAKELGFATGTPIKLHSIACSNVATVGQNIIIRDGDGGNPIFNQKVDVANETITKDFGGMWAKNVVISDSSLVGANISIVLE